MSLSLASFQWVAEELVQELEGGIIQRMHEIDRDTWVFRVRQPGRTLRVLVCLRSGMARVHLVDARPPKRTEHPGGLSMLLRKWTVGMVLARVEALPGERIMRWTGHTSDPSWRAEEHDEDARPPRVPVSLVFELTGQHANLFVLGEEERILGQHARDRLEDAARRPGQPWHPPTRPDGEEPDARAEAMPFAEAAGADAPRSAALVAFYQEREDALDEQSLRVALARALKQRVRRARRLVRNIEGDLQRAEEAQVFRKYGELLQSAYGRVPRGASEARVPDYYVEGMPEVVIPLDPARDLKANIQHFFKQYRRLHDATDQIEERLLEKMEELETLEAARAQLPELDTLEDLQTLHDTLADAGLIPRDPGAARRRQRPQTRAERKPYRTFTAMSGRTILVGRGSKSNDELTTRIARGRDVWLHARDWAGAHVVLRMDRDAEPDQADLHDAALLAAHFSKGSGDLRVDVTHTRAKHVRKPRGAAPGLVHVAGGATLTVRLDTPRLQKLLQREVPD